MGISGKVKDTTTTFVAILSLGLVGLLFLIVFGNLSGNLGFDRIGTDIINESSGYAINGTTYTLDNQSQLGFVSLAVNLVHNATNSSEIVIASGNYTVDTTAGTITGSAGRTSNWTDVNVSYTSITKDISERNTDLTISNLTGGAVTFFGFSNVWFTLLAIVLLIIIVISVIQIVSGKKAGGFAS